MRRFLIKLFSNFYYKVAAVLLAGLFWYIVQGEEILELNKRVVVNLRIPDGYLVQGPKTIIKDVTLMGPRVLVSQYNDVPIDAELFVEKGRTGRLRYRLTKDNIPSLDDRLRLTVHDAYISIFVDRKAEKKVTVKEFLKGTPAEGALIEKIEINPPEVVVTGLLQELRKISEIKTEPIDIQGLQQSKSFEVKLASQEFPFEDISTDVVQVFLSVGEKKENMKFSSVPVEIVGSEYLAAVKPQSVSVVVQGTPGVLKFLKRSDFETFVEARDLEPGKRYTRPIQVKIPPNTVLIETVPENVTLEIYNQKRLN